MIRQGILSAPNSRRDWQLLNHGVHQRRTRASEEQHLVNLFVMGNYRLEKQDREHQHAEGREEDGFLGKRSEDEHHGHPKEPINGMENWSEFEIHSSTSGDLEAEHEI
jgi:hypothetical protein